MTDKERINDEEKEHFYKLLDECVDGILEDAVLEDEETEEESTTYNSLLEDEKELLERIEQGDKNRLIERLINGSQSISVDPDLNICTGYDQLLAIMEEKGLVINDCDLKYSKEELDLIADLNILRWKRLKEHLKNPEVKIVNYWEL